MSKNEVKFKTYSSFKNFKEDEENGILYIEGYASKSYHKGKPVVDYDNEFVDVTKFDLSTCTTLLFNHNQYEYAVGKCTLEQRPDGAYLRGEIHKSLNPKVYYAVKHGIMTDMSIGFVATNAEYKTIDGEEIFSFTDGFVYETSICNVIGANPLAKINTSKSLKADKEAIEVAKWLEEVKTPKLKEETQLKSIIEDGKCVGFSCEVEKLKEANPTTKCSCQKQEKETKGKDMTKEEQETQIKNIQEKIIKGLTIDETLNEPWNVDSNLWYMFGIFIQTIEDNIYEFKWSDSFDKEEMLTNINSAMEIFKQTIEVESTRIGETIGKDLENKGETKDMDKDKQIKSVETEEVKTETSETQSETETKQEETKPEEVQTNSSETESQEEVSSKENQENQEPKEDLAKTSEEEKLKEDSKDEPKTVESETTEPKTEPKEEVKEETKQEITPRLTALDIKLEEASADEIKEAYDTLADKLEEIEAYVTAELEKTEN